ncbi:WXG100 family type VII secretion target [Nocardia sp. NPDC055321]
MAADDGMLYDPAVISQLVSELRENFGQLKAAGTDMETAAGKLQQAWSAQAWAGFSGVYTKWTTEYSDSLHKLNAVAAAVEDAMGRALGADQKIGDGFGAF